MNTAAGDDRLTTLAAILAATLMIAQHVAGKAARDALFLTLFDVARLPQMMIASASLSVVTVLVVSRLMGRIGPARLVPPVFFGSCVLFFGEWMLMGFAPRVVAVTLYLHITVFGAVLISGFWSMINERFDPYTAKRTIARLAAAATLGGLLGGVAAKVVGTAADIRTILLMLGGLHLVCSLSLAYVARGQREPPRPAEPGKFVLTPLKENPLIRGMAVLLVLMGTTIAVLDFMLKSTAAETLPKDELIAFFSYFYMLVGLGGFLVQTFLGNKALRWLGLGGAMAAWPVVVLLGGSLALVLKNLITVTLLRAGANLFYNSFFRSGFELLYTPIPAADKRAGKILIDVGAERSGRMLGSLLIMAILLLPAAADQILLFAAVVLAAVCLLLIYLLHQGYVRQLADNLRNGRLRPEEISVRDATTRQTVAATQVAMERDKLLDRIARSRQDRSTADIGREAQPPCVEADPLVSAIVDLRSGDRERVRRVLASQELTPALVPHAIPLLRGPDDLRELFVALRPLASAASGQLVDALLDRKQHPVIRRRLPLVLGQADTQRAVEGLMDGLEDLDWDVRFRCGEALGKLRAKQPDLAYRPAELIALAEREIDAAGRQVSPGPGAGVSEDERVNHLFNLLGVAYGPQVLELCRQALASGDQGLRGTALEYLENLLPAALRSRLWPLIDAGVTASPGGRSTQEIARELLGAAGRLKDRMTAGAHLAPGKPDIAPTLPVDK